MISRKLLKIFIISLVFVLILVIAIAWLIGNNSILKNWQSLDINTNLVGATTSPHKGVIIIKAGGEDIWRQNDSFRFVYQKINGDFEITAKFWSLEATHPWAKTGLMVRQTLDKSSPHIFLEIGAENGYKTIKRTTFGGDTNPAGDAPSYTFPIYLKLVKQGDYIFSLTSQNGVNWELAETQKFPGVYKTFFSDSIYLGIATSAHNQNALTTTQITDLKLAKPTKNYLAEYLVHATDKDNADQTETNQQTTPVSQPKLLPTPKPNPTPPQSTPDNTGNKKDTKPKREASMNIKNGFLYLDDTDLGKIIPGTSFYSFPKHNSLTLSSTEYIYTETISLTENNKWPKRQTIEIRDLSTGNTKKIIYTKELRTQIMGTGRLKFLSHANGKVYFVSDECASSDCHYPVSVLDIASQKISKIQIANTQKLLVWGMPTLSPSGQQIANTDHWAYGSPYDIALNIYSLVEEVVLARINTSNLDLPENLNWSKFSLTNYRWTTDERYFVFDATESGDLVKSFVYSFSDNKVYTISD